MRVPCDSQGMIDSLMDGVNFNGFFYCLTGPFIRSFPVYMAFLHSATKHQHGATVGKVTMHSIILDIMNDVRLIYLLLYLGFGSSLHHHVSTELTRQDHQSPVQAAALLKILRSEEHRGG